MAKDINIVPDDFLNSQWRLHSDRNEASDIDSILQHNSEFDSFFPLSVLGRVRHRLARQGLESVLLKKLRHHQPLGYP